MRKFIVETLILSAAYTACGLCIISWLYGAYTLIMKFSR